MLRYLKANMGIDQTPLAEAMKFAQQTRRDIAQATRIGLAWITTGKGIIWHNGGTGGYKSFLGFTAGRRRGVVILTNTARDADDLGFATLDADAPLAPAYKAIVLPNEQLDEYVGTYKLADKFLLKVFRQNEGLFAQATGQSAFPFSLLCPTSFLPRLLGLASASRGMPMAWSMGLFCTRTATVRPPN